ncbi:MAG: hypothetical protein CV088_01360 [Nitrospira sp. LK70]|nr:hypothetical protein [Nitrospira sp. LK70]
MKTLMIMGCLVCALAAPDLALNAAPSLGAVTSPTDGTGWKLYTNDRFGFSVRYPDDWRLGNQLPGGIGVTMLPSIEHSLVALSGHMNVVRGSSQDGRQTLEEFAASHRRVITQLYDKKKMEIIWQKDANTSLAGFPAKRMTFTYQDDRRNAMLEVHIFSLGRKEGRGVRIKMPADRTVKLMPTIRRMLQSYEAGRDQNAVSPIVPKEKD